MEDVPQTVCSKLPHSYRHGGVNLEGNGRTGVGYMDNAFRDVAREPMEKSGILSTEKYQSDVVVVL